MSKDSVCCSEGLIPAEPLPPGAHDFSRKVTSLLDGSPKEEAVVAQALAGHEAMLEQMAAGMYTMASMMVGAGEDSVQLVETAVANTDISVCQDAHEGRRSNRRAIARAAIRLLAERTPGCLDAPVGVEFPRTCIEDDDLESAGVSSEELETMIAGPDRERVRTWLESLPADQRAIFVLRAVGTISSQETAALLAAHGGPGAAAWTADSVREVFRQALCSLASQLIQSSGTR
jgi:hypothetical protein